METQPESYEGQTHHSSQFAKAVETGRCDHYALDVGCATTLSIYNLYGWTGGHQNKKKAARTNSMCEAVEEEIFEQPDGPTAIVEDMNADKEDLQSLRARLASQGWTDAGAEAQR